MRVERRDSMTRRGLIKSLLVSAAGLATGIVVGNVLANYVEQKEEVRLVQYYMWDLQVHLDESTQGFAQIQEVEIDKLKEMYPVYKEHVGKIKLIYDPIRQCLIKKT